MGVPKKKCTKAKRNKRRGEYHLKISSFVKCSKCGKDTLPHRVCAFCGYYKGREIINVMAELEKKKKAGEAKAETLKTEKKEESKKEQVQTAETVKK